MTTATDTPRIYVACLASYNNGILHGEWIDATDYDCIMDEIKKMLAKSPEPGAEEWAIHDYECFGGIRISEYEGIEKVAELGALIEEHGEAFAVFADHEGVDYATAEGFEDSYCGEYKNEEDYAEELFDELYEIPEHLVSYIDYEKVARDLFIDDYWGDYGSDGQFHVFRRC